MMMTTMINYHGDDVNDGNHNDGDGDNDDGDDNDIGCEDGNVNIMVVIETQLIHNKISIHASIKAQIALN